MPHERMQQYLESIEALVRKLRNAYIERYEEENLTAERANIRLKIRFQSGALLEINEAIAVEDGFWWVEGCTRPDLKEVLDEAVSWEKMRSGN